MSINLDDHLRASLPGGFIQLTDGVTYYELAGTVDRPLVILVHGLSVPSYIWEPAFKTLRRAGFCVLRYDLFGRGYSDRPRAAYTLDFFERQLAELLAALDLRQQLSVIGLSMGGPIAAAFAAHQPARVARLGLIDPAGLLDWNPPSLRLLRLPVIGELLMELNGEQFVVSSQASDFYNPERFPAYGAPHPFMVLFLCIWPFPR